ncbi:hypothetical protein ACQP00_20785 [Dactylosporangium sp. CS-047395]|uniref:hypothetical protein n=1 Tax=Dactylosporangium sp. CS-047395 TaxID=3239936 RepID=UPI003D8AF0C2
MRFAFDDPCGNLGIGPTVPNWSFSGSSPDVAQMMGVLAAVAFGGVLLIAQSPQPADGHSALAYRDRALNSLLLAFFTLMITALLYSIIDGVLLCSRLAIQGLLAGIAFAVSAMITFLSLSWLAAVHFHGVSLKLVKLIAFTVVLISAAFIAETIAVSVQILHPQLPAETGFLYWGIIPCALIVYLGASYPGPQSIPLAMRYAVMACVVVLCVFHIASIAAIDSGTAEALPDGSAIDQPEADGEISGDASPRTVDTMKTDHEDSDPTFVRSFVFEIRLGRRR